MFAARSLIHLPAAFVSNLRHIHPSPAAYKSVTEKVGEVADKVNKSVGKGLADAIDKGEKATNAAKDTIASATKDKKKGAEKKVRDTSEALKEASQDRK